MDTILFESQPNAIMIEKMCKEVPHIRCVVLPSDKIHFLLPDQWKQIEIIYGDHLTTEQLYLAEDLRWIHVPTHELKNLCLPEIIKRGNIIVTTSHEELLTQTSEYVMACILSFSKQLFSWRHLEIGREKNLADDTLASTMWTLNKKTMIQIGLGVIGVEIAHKASQLGISVTGVQRRKSFRPYCEKVISYKNLHQVLPNADIVCVCLPKSEPPELLLGLKELELIKENAILVVIGSHHVIDLEALIKMANSQRFRVALDFSDFNEIPKTSELWKIDQLILTPGIAEYPKTISGHAFTVFHRNLRHYLLGNYNDLRNRIIGY